MACPAKGSRTRITAVEESTFGVTPTDPDTQIIPRATSAINLTKDVFDDPTIRSNGQKSFSRHGNKRTGGDIGVSYASKSYDFLLSNVFQNDWNGNVLKLGQIGKSLSIQVEHLDKNLIFLHTGLRGSTFSMEVNTTGVVSSTFGFLGLDTTTPGTSIDDDGPIPAPDRQPFTHAGGTFKEGGAVSGVITGISLSMDNQMDSDYVLGSNKAICISNSEVMVSGTVTAFFTSLDLYNKFLNETESSLEFSGIRIRGCYLKSNSIRATFP